MSVILVSICDTAAIIIGRIFTFMELEIENILELSNNHGVREV